MLVGRSPFRWELTERLRDQRSIAAGRQQDEPASEGRVERERESPAPAAAATPQLVGGALLTVGRLIGHCSLSPPTIIALARPPRRQCLPACLQGFAVGGRRNAMNGRRQRATNSFPSGSLLTVFTVNYQCGPLSQQLCRQTRDDKVFFRKVYFS